MGTLYTLHHGMYKMTTHSASAVLGSQDGQTSQLPFGLSSGEGQEGPPRDLDVGMARTGSGSLRHVS